MATQESIKLTEEEVNNISELKNRQESLGQELQKVQLSKFNLEIREEELKQYYKDNIALEKQIGQELMQKYGNGSIDIETGTFVPFHK